MIERSAPFSHIQQILAADHRCCEIDPGDDQIWELNTSRGEPPGVALQTTYGLRAYGMRVFPRFIQNKIPLSDPHAFAMRPVMDFSAPNFLSLRYSPFNSIDVIQKVWVPDSHTLVGQIKITNTTAAMFQLGMEWVVLLNPMSNGSPMTATQISVNTVLFGQIHHLFPVFFLTGGPLSDISNFPSLGLELSLTPKASRQFSWALSSLESTDASFYNARKSTAYSLDNEQVKISMLQKQQMVDFDFGDTVQDCHLSQSQQRTFQLIMPAWNDFNHPAYVTNRLPDQGFNIMESSNEFSSGWGVQRIHEILEISRMLLPARPDLIKELLQNLIDHQGDDGTIFAQTSWNGNITGLPAPPLSATLALDLYDHNADLEWLKQVFPSLLRSVRIWFGRENDFDQDGYPEWKHLLQTGIAESPQFDHQIKTELDILVRSAEWPSLAALLIQELQKLKRMGELTGDISANLWLDERCQRLQTLLQECWDEEAGFYHFRDKETHIIQGSKSLHTFRQDGSSEIKLRIPNPTRLCLKIHKRDNDSRFVECRIKGIVNHHEKVILFRSRRFVWEDEAGFAVSDEIFSAIKQISVSGLKKGDRLIVETPDFTFRGPDFMVPLWAGIPSHEQAQKLIQQGSKYLDGSSLVLPNVLKLMWIEGLDRYSHRELACQYYQRWFFRMSTDQVHDLDQFNFTRASLNELPPLRTLLQLLGIQKITEDEVILTGFNEFFPKVNVQYKRFLFVLDKAQTRIQNLNGESILITKPGAHRIMLS